MEQLLAAAAPGTVYDPDTVDVVQADVDAWLARALTAHRGHYADPAAREAAVNVLTESR